MGLFGLKKRVPLLTIIDGVLTALDDVRELQNFRQRQFADSLTDCGNGGPDVKHLKIGDREMEIPHASMLSRDTMEIKEVNISFQVKIRDLEAQAAAGSMSGKPLTYEDLAFLLEKAEEGDKDSVKISISLKGKLNEALE